jgi:hypothetical protein
MAFAFAPLPPPVFGPVAWASLDDIIGSYPTSPSLEEEAAMREYIYSLRFLIPCRNTCRDHWIQILKDMPPDVTNRSTLFKWYVAAKNRVNENIPGAPQVTEAAARENFRKKTTAARSVVVYLDESGKVVHSTSRLPPTLVAEKDDENDKTKSQNQNQKWSKASSHIFFITMAVVLAAAAFIFLKTSFSSSSSSSSFSSNSNGNSNNRRRRRYSYARRAPVHYRVSASDSASDFFREEDSEPRKSPF